MQKMSRQQARELKRLNHERGLKMKRFIAVLATLSSWVSLAWGYDFGNLTWGMTPEQVEQTEGVKLKQELPAYNYQLSSPERTEKFKESIKWLYGKCATVS